MDARTPPDERWDLNQEIWQNFVSELKDPERVREAMDDMFGMPGLMAKAVRLESSWDLRNPHRVDRGRGHTSILYLNEMGVVGSIGTDSQYVERPGAGFEFLRTVVNQIDLVKAIILTRQRQIEAFCTTERDPSPLGFRFVRRDGQKLTKGDRKEVTALEEWILNSGDLSDPRARKRARRENMAGFVRKLVWDTLSADACPIETQMTRAGKLSGIYNVPFDTVRLCTEEGYQGQDQIFAVQVVNAVPEVAFTYDDLIYEVRNPRTDLTVNGYGFSEPEMIIRALTAYVNAVEFNMSGMDRNSFPRGMLAIFGKYAPREQQDFRRNLKAMLHGARNRWTMPVIFGEEQGGGAHFVPIDQFNEMFFARWIVLVSSIACAVYGIHPTEVHFDSFSARSTTPLGGDDTAEKLAHSRDKGLVPTVKFVEGIYNQYILPLLTRKYDFQFVGLHGEDQAHKHERIKLASTIDEIREIDGRDPMKLGALGAAPSNPSLLQVYMASLQEARGRDEDDADDGDYPQDGGGRHLPYRDDANGEPPEDEHFHTLTIGDKQERSPGRRSRPERAREEQALAKAEVPVRRRRQVGRFSVVIERDIDEAEVGGGTASVGP